MTETELRAAYISAAQSFLGCKESDGSHKKIIDLYNTQKKLPRNWKLRYTDDWCAGFATAVGIKANLSDIILPECSCGEMIALYQKAGRWQESDSYTPKPGDLVFYDWQDDGKGNNTGWPDHVGIVVTASSSSIKVIEGNKGDAVAYRTISVNGKNIRGFALPNYASKATTKAPAKAAVKTIDVQLTVLKKGAAGEEVKTLQRLLITNGYTMKSGGKVYGVDGSFGAATEAAVRAYQKDKGLAVDGSVGKATWTKLLKG